MCTFVDGDENQSHSGKSPIPNLCETISYWDKESFKLLSKPIHKYITPFSYDFI